MTLLHWFTAPFQDNVTFPSIPEPRREILSFMGWKVHGHQPHDHMCPLDAMNAGYLESSTDGCQGMKQACILFVFQSGRAVRCNTDVNRLSALLYFYI